MENYLEKINKFTRREFTEEELYTFSVILCDNDVDRDCERFSDEALESLKSLFIGKTGIFDHDPSTSNQTARIFDTEIVSDESRRTKNNEAYKYLKGYAYMVRTDDNKNLIAEIDGGIKKEVSISCSASKRRCSVCGNDAGKCSHIRGKNYGGKMCHTVLDDISDAYEWSFVAVPAQVNAGVTKKYTEDGCEKSGAASAAVEAENSLRREIRRLAFFRGGTEAAEAVEISAKNMNTPQLQALKRAYEKTTNSAGGIEVQLMPEMHGNRTAVYKI